MAEPSSSLSAAQTAYNIREIRQAILHFLPPLDLARFMRVERECIDDVARDLYRKVAFEVSEAIGSAEEVSRAYSPVESPSLTPSVPP